MHLFVASCSISAPVSAKWSGKPFPRIAKLVVAKHPVKKIKHVSTGNLQISLHGFGFIFSQKNNIEKTPLYRYSGVLSFNQLANLCQKMN
jgi:hypothetical protein